jgi:hypothetical protein
MTDATATTLQALGAQAITTAGSSYVGRLTIVVSRRR